MERRLGALLHGQSCAHNSPERAAEGYDNHVNLRLSGTLRQCRAFGLYRLDCRYISAARQHASRGRRKVMRMGTSSVGTPEARSCTALAKCFHFQMALWVRVRVTGSSMRPGMLRLLGLGASPAAGLCAPQAARCRTRPWLQCCQTATELGRLTGRAQGPLTLRARTELASRCHSALTVPLRLESTVGYANGTFAEHTSHRLTTVTV